MMALSIEGGGREGTRVGLAEAFGTRAARDVTLAIYAATKAGRHVHDRSRTSKTARASSTRLERVARAADARVR